MAETSPRLLAAEGRRFYDKKDYLAAARAFAEAADLYTAGADALSAAEMKNNQSVALLQAGDAQAALKSASGTEKVFAQAGDIRRQALALGNQAAAREALGQREKAIALYEKSAALLEQAGEDQLRADVMKSLATLQVKSGKTIDAVVSMQSGMAGVKKPTFKQWLLKRLLRMPKWW